MRCPVCDDELMFSEERCTFCGYDMRTGRRGHIEPPPEGAAARAWREGLAHLFLGCTCVALGFGATLTFLRLLGIAVISGAGGMVGRGMYLVSVARRFAKKQRLFDEQRLLAGPATGEDGSVVAVSGFLGR